MEGLVIIGLIFWWCNTEEPEIQKQPEEVIEEQVEEVPISSNAVNVKEVMGLAEALKALKEFPKN